MLNLNIPCFENIVDTDQLASKKPADQDLHCFHPILEYMQITDVLQVNWQNIEDV